MTAVRTRLARAIAYLSAGTRRTEIARRSSQPRHRRERLGVEALEQRLVLTPITWTGKADGVSWQVADNWDLRRVPAASDDVIIPDIASSPNVTYSQGITSINSLTSFETLVLSGGSLSIDGKLRASQLNGPFFQTGGVLMLGGGNLGSAQPLRMQGGVLAGAGTVTATVENAAGELSPHGILTINGNYVQGPGGRLTVEIGGLTPGIGFDQLQVTGQATLDGTLNLKLKPNVVATAGDNFEILTFGSSFGQFSASFGLELGGGRVFEKTFGPNGLFVVFKVVNTPPFVANPIPDLTVLED